MAGTICSTVNDIKSNKHHSGMTQALSLNSLKEHLTIFQNTGDDTCIRDLILRSFSSLDTLNSSFLNDQELSPDDPGISLEDVREFYRLIPEPLTRPLLVSIDALLRRPTRDLRKPSDVRVLVIIFENHLLMNRSSRTAQSILKRLCGYLSNLDNQSHHLLVSWFAKLPADIFQTRLDLLNGFISARLSRHLSGRSDEASLSYSCDWKIRCAARTIALFFAANLQSPIIPVNSFYNTLVDYVDLINDFANWEQRLQKFSFCQYPFLLSIGSKISIMEYDAKRQMELKAREAFFTTLFQRRAVHPHLLLKVRRSCIIEDSLAQLGRNEMEIKKGLRIEFIGEDGVDAGGLRKEWFLLLCRQIFDPQYGMFTRDEDACYCWFNPFTFEVSDNFYLLGLVLGLAMYNSTILDIPLPLAMYKKLLGQPCSLDDLLDIRPGLARGLKQLLEYEGDVETMFCRDFIGELEVFEMVERHPLCPGGESIPVTNENRRDYAEKYVVFLLDTSIAKQFEPFKRGFYHVCGGNALSLFRPEEIQALVIGSPDPLNVLDLCAVATYDGTLNPEKESVISWFWSFWSNVEAAYQRKILSFITGSDRIPATGSANMMFKISILGDDSNRLPIAHTCFNQICLYRYRTLGKFESKFRDAVDGSQGFGLK
ncbi:putative E3 ubiquitin-protein ligase mug30 [Neolecta irregularis DAH-3]|uniref:HECT-type E3 ubiquitin transferase n=1 Tax=Neolecta irregularis (strain DAH-3) TaxID=1198029 RepID=A0A1U7LQP0_NEOID|nr:putative E3 ubiquitin-protein ligase mug30 [Neolecta irregularis DAH-3]|eukprot:OLL24990.1 putative E3 ubiquitin-protein ligase mug30 [Neolecta irregularis DAH-3]